MTEKLKHWRSYENGVAILMQIISIVGKGGNMSARFKAGDIVKIKFHRYAKFFIVEACTQTCYAGVEQIFYTGRIFYEKNNIKTELEAGIFNDYRRFSDIELEPLPEIKLNENYSKFKSEKEKYRALKENYIKEQDFEKAAQARDSERKASDMMKLFEEVE